MRATSWDVLALAGFCMAFSTLIPLTSGEKCWTSSWTYKYCTKCCGSDYAEYCCSSTSIATIDSVPIGAIAGGICGVIAFIFIISAAVYICKKHHTISVGPAQIFTVEADSY